MRQSVSYYNMEYTIQSHHVSEFSQLVNNIPLETEILNIHYLTIPAGGVINNLPIGIKEVNILGDLLFLKHFDEKHNFSNSTKVNLRKLFPKRPLNCKFFITEEADDGIIYVFNQKRN